MGDNNNLKMQLATVVRNVQWSYAIFWSPSPNESRVLEWGDGYYNGGIKTRRTIQSMDLKADDQTVSLRSDQLRELYMSLLSGNTTTTQTRRPLAALSPEDLTDVEWFYLVCMSFVLNIGQGLPGRSLASGKTIWLSDAHQADTGVFTRSLLAKSAGIKTVVCFPFLDGVIELGVTELVQEDLNLIQHVRASLLENTSPQAAFYPLVQGENTELLSPCGSSNGAELIQPLSDVFLFEGLGGVIENDQLSNNCVITSMTSSDCISQTVVNPENLPPASKTEVTYDTNLQDKNRFQICDQQRRISQLVRPISKDLHYQSVLSSLFEKSHQGILQQSDQQKLDKKSGFIGWEKVDNEKFEVHRFTTPQYMLKKILFDVPKMISAHLVESKEESVIKDDLCKQEVNTNHVLAERRRREKVNERFSTLRSLIPSISKADKISILDDTIAYLKELERRVEELEPCQESIGYDMKKKRKIINIEEGTSDNYGSDMNECVKSKRKGREIKGGEQECLKLSARDTLVIDNTITISMVDKEILINISCPWRENLLLQIIDSMSSLQLDSQSVHSSTVDDVLSLKIQSKLKGCNSVSVELITQTLLRVIKSSS